ncbi:hypothetical protein JTE90_022376 [Oedothorax gibbosus]|uniref:Prolyl 4-hydroxylase subunit alpha-2 n=1 Tax=Oedothorax gibbosus TaxID=931172 RepID=A0AAV6ULW8_9ARAC|nr:hypothetical protein JTE90_022376 [Oedothorax gibbosus]
MKTQAKKLILLFLLLNTFARSEYASALVDLEPLLITQGKISQTLANYIDLEEKRLEKITRLAEEYKAIYKSASKNVEHFLANPMNSYLLVKRLTTDWKFLRHFVVESTSKNVVYNFTKEEIFPNDYDLGEAANTVLTLQETYSLNITDLVKGKVAGKTGATELRASDCFELGMTAYNESDYSLAVLWFQESMDRLDTDEFQIVNKTKLLECFSFAAFVVGDLKKALKLTQDLVKINPQHRYYKHLLFYEKELLKKTEESDEINKNTAEKTEDETDPLLFNIENYRKLCRGERLRSPNQERKLKCRYTSNGSNYLLLQPAKEETLNLDPWIVLYHDVIRDNDIEIFKTISEPLLKRAKIIPNEVDTKAFSKHRVSKK